MGARFRIACARRALRSCAREIPVALIELRRALGNRRRGAQVARVPVHVVARSDDARALARQRREGAGIGRLDGEGAGLEARPQRLRGGVVDLRRLEAVLCALRDGRTVRTLAEIAASAR
jgi:hypothetical protein